MCIRDRYKIPRKIETEVVEACTMPKRYSYGVGSTGQRLLWGEAKKEENDEFVSRSWMQLLEKVDEINNKFICGEIQYDAYSKGIKSLNEQCKKAEIPLKVDLISQCDFDILLSMHAWDLITCDPGYEHLDPTDSAIEMLGYNNSYGVGGLM